MGKRKPAEGIKISNEEYIKILGEKEDYKYFRILEADTIKQEEIKEKIRRECLRSMRKLLETKIGSRNLIKEINA